MRTAHQVGFLVSIEDTLAVVQMLAPALWEVRLCESQGDLTSGLLEQLRDSLVIGGRGRGRRGAGDDLVDDTARTKVGGTHVCDRGRHGSHDDAGFLRLTRYLCQSEPQRRLQRQLGEGHLAQIA